MRHVWSEHYWILSEPDALGKYQKHILLSLSDVENYPELPRKIYLAIHKKAASEVKKLRVNYPETKNLVVKHTKYLGEANSEYRWGAGYYFWLEVEPEPIYILGEG